MFKQLENLLEALFVKLRSENSYFIIISRKTSCGTSTIPTNSRGTGKRFSGGVVQNTPTPSLTASLIPYLKGIQCCWLSEETIYPIKNDFLSRKNFFFISFSPAHKFFFFPFVLKCSIIAFFFF